MKKRMKKSIAFTMSEALIVLGIVSVLAAISVVAISNAKPDDNIVMFRRAYSTASAAVQEMLNDRELYPNAENLDTESVLGSVNDNKLGFKDTVITAEMINKYPYLSGVAANRKFATILKRKLNPVSEDEDGFTTADGLYWAISGGNFNVAHGGPTAMLNIDVSLNGKNNSCSYNASTCPTPTEFTFRVDPSTGVITPEIETANHGGLKSYGTDPMGCSYLRFPKITKNSQIPTDGHLNSCFPVTDEVVADAGSTGSTGSGSAAAPAASGNPYTSTSGGTTSGGTTSGSTSSGTTSGSTSSGTTSGGTTSGSSSSGTTSGGTTSGSSSGGGHHRPVNPTPH